MLVDEQSWKVNLSSAIPRTLPLVPQLHGRAWSTVPTHRLRFHQQGGDEGYFHVPFTDRWAGGQRRPRKPSGDMGRPGQLGSREVTKDDSMFR